MAYRFEVDASSRSLLFRFSGTVSGQRTDQFYREATEQIERIQPRAAIFDFTDVVEFDVTTDVIRNMAELPPLLPDASCPRIVVAPAVHIFGMSRMFQILGERNRPEFRIVRSMAEALDALALAHAEFKVVSPE